MALKRSSLEDKTYLVVDDFGDMRSLIKNMLLSCGAGDIMVAINGAEAITKMESKRFDVVLCDYNLGPGKDGQQVLEEARHRNLVGLGTVFVMITAENTREMVMGAVEYEPDSYLTKPFNKDLLKSRLEKLLTKKSNLHPVEQAVDKKDFVRAIDLLDQLIAAKPPNIGELRKLKAEICLQSDDIDKAIMLYESILSVREMPWARLGLGKALFKAKRYDEAKEIFRDLIRENERYTAAYDWLARTLKCLNQMSDAQEVLQKATDLSPKAIVRQRALGELALSNNDVDIAQKAFGNAVKLGRHSVYKHPSIYANLAKVTTESKSGAEGLKIIKEMEREFGDDSEANFFAASAESVIHESMGNHEASKQSLNRAESLYDSLSHHMNTEHSLELAKTLNRVGETEKAKELLHQVVCNNHSDEEMLSEVGATMDALGLQIDTADFIAQIRKEIVKLNNEGVNLAKKGNLDEAIKLFEEAAERMSGNKVVNLNTARVWLMSMDGRGVSSEGLSKVRYYLDRVKRVDPDNSTMRKLQSRFQEMASQL